MATYRIEIGDGQSRDGGGTTEQQFASWAAALDGAREWTLEGDWEHATPGASVEVTVSRLDGSRVAEARTLSVGVGHLAY